MLHKLYLIEGLPCSGKSSVSQYVAQILEEKQKEVLYYDEGTPGHPADYEFHAFLNGKRFNLLKKQEKEQLLRVAKSKLDGYVVPLDMVGDELRDKLLPYKIYDNLSWEEERPIMLEHWREFAKEAENGNHTYVFNCCFLQNPFCEMMIRLNLSIKEIAEYIKGIYTMIKKLNPVIIYLKCSDPDQRIRQVSKDRDSKWLEEVIEYHTKGAYGSNNGLTGFDGYISALVKRQECELNVLEQIPVHKIIINNPYEDWNRSHNQIEKVLSQVECNAKFA